MPALNLALYDEIECHNLLGENIRWHPQHASFYWTDILAKKLYRWHVTNKKLSEYATPYRLCSFEFIQGSDALLAAFDKGIARFTPETGDYTWLARPELGLKENRFNDGKCDPLGRFWVGSMNESDKEPVPQTASLYCFDVVQNRIVYENVFNKVMIANGLAFCEDLKSVYFADSPTKTIKRFTLSDNTKPLINKADVFYQTVNGVPDGATMDKNGHYWFANWAGSKVCCLDQSGHLVHEIAIPAFQPTCVAIGGENMDLLCVTSASVGLQKVKQDGNVFIYQLDASLGLSPEFAKKAFALAKAFKLNG